MTIHHFPTPRTRAFIRDVIRWKLQGRIKRHHMDQAIATEMRKYGLKTIYIGPCKLTLLDRAYTPGGIFDRVLIEYRGGGESESYPSCSGAEASYLTGESVMGCTGCSTIYRKEVQG